jgi:hypothetical protein
MVISWPAPTPTEPPEPTCPDGQILVDGECQEPPPDEEPPEDGGGGDDGDNGDGGDGGDDGDVIIENYEITREETHISIVARQVNKIKQKRITNYKDLA